MKTPQQQWKERHPVTLRFPEGIGDLLDHHAHAVGVSRRALAERVIDKHTAEAARSLVQEMAERLDGEQTTERSSA